LAIVTTDEEALKEPDSRKYPVSRPQVPGKTRIRARRGVLARAARVGADVILVRNNQSDAKLALSQARTQNRALSTLAHNRREAEKRRNKKKQAKLLTRMPVLKENKNKRALWQDEADQLHKRSAKGRGRMGLYTSKKQRSRATRERALATKHDINDLDLLRSDKKLNQLRPTALVAKTRRLELARAARAAELEARKGAAPPVAAPTSSTSTTQAEASKATLIKRHSTMLNRSLVPSRVPDSFTLMESGVFHDKKRSHFVLTDGTVIPVRFTTAQCRQLIAKLLERGGIELNPGPPKKKNKGKEKLTTAEHLKQYQIDRETTRSKLDPDVERKVFETYKNRIVPKSRSLSEPESEESDGERQTLSDYDAYLMEEEEVVPRTPSPMVTKGVVIKPKVITMRYKPRDTAEACGPAKDVSRYFGRVARVGVGKTGMQYCFIKCLEMKQDYYYQVPQRQQAHEDEQVTFRIVPGKRGGFVAEDVAQIAIQGKTTKAWEDYDKRAGAAKPSNPPPPSSVPSAPSAPPASLAEVVSGRGRKRQRSPSQAEATSTVPVNVVPQRLADPNGPLTGPAPSSKGPVVGLGPLGPPPPRSSMPSDPIQVSDERVPLFAPEVVMAEPSAPPLTIRPKKRRASPHPPAPDVGLIGPGGAPGLYGGDQAGPAGPAAAAAPADPAAPPPIPPAELRGDVLENPHRDVLGLFEFRCLSTYLSDERRRIGKSIYGPCATFMDARVEHAAANPADDRPISWRNVKRFESPYDMRYVRYSVGPRVSYVLTVAIMFLILVVLPTSLPSWINPDVRQNINVYHSAPFPWTVRRCYEGFSSYSSSSDVNGTAPNWPLVHCVSDQVLEWIPHLFFYTVHISYSCLWMWVFSYLFSKVMHPIESMEDWSLPPWWFYLLQGFFVSIPYAGQAMSYVVLAVWTAYQMPWVTRLHVLSYSPHIVTCLLTEYMRGTNVDVMKATIHSKALRLAAFPLPDLHYVTATQVLHGSEEVALFMAQTRVFGYGPLHQLDALVEDYGR